WVRGTSADDERRAEALTHAGRGSARRPHIGCAHRRGPARPRGLLRGRDLRATRRGLHPLSERPRAGYPGEQRAWLERPYRAEKAFASKNSIGGSSFMTGGFAITSSSCASRSSSAFSTRVEQQNSTMMPLGSSA